MKAWLREHSFAIGAALAQLRRAPGSFSFNVLVVAIALIIFVFAALGIHLP